MLISILLLLLLIIVIVALSILNKIEKNSCPAGEQHEWNYDHNSGNLAYFKCRKCEGTKEELKTENEINFMNYEKKKNSYRWS